MESCAIPDAHESPFAAYLRRIDAALRALPAEKCAAIRRELLAHLHDAADEAGADPSDPLLQERVIWEGGAAVEWSRRLLDGIGDGAVMR